MEEKVIDVINSIRESKGQKQIKNFTGAESLREDLGLTSFDLAELTVKIEDEFDIDIFEDGLVRTLSEIFEKLQK